MDNPDQQNFVAFVGKEHLLPIAKQISNFLAEPEAFVNYERPPQEVDLSEDPSGAVRQEMIKTFALASIVYEDDLAEKRNLPFKHHPIDDIAFLKQCEVELQNDISMINTFGEFTNILGELKDEDKVSESAL